MSAQCFRMIRGTGHGTSELRGLLRLLNGSNKKSFIIRIPIGF